MHKPFNIQFFAANLEIKLFIHYDVIKNADGKDIIKPTKYNFDFEVKDHAHYHLTNLFNGNKELSKYLLSLSIPIN